VRVATAALALWCELLAGEIQLMADEVGAFLDHTCQHADGPILDLGDCGWTLTEFDGTKTEDCLLTGTCFVASEKGLGATDAYKKWDASFLGAYSFGPHTIQLGLKGSGEAGNDPLPRYDLVQWGGLFQQSGYRTGALVGERLRFARLVYMGRVAQQPLFDGLYAGASLEVGRMDKPLVPGSPTGTLKSVAAFFSLDTLLGPLYLGYGWAADGSRSAYLYLGQMP